ncbi:MAG: alpha-E domain-containing protein [Alphaproteobacteria bacterium]|nr:alpha-E domain-containing protein [Alphaproteobacteria bacterium]
MLSRTADNLFWMGRSVERAENTARMLDVTYRNAMLPSATATASSEWEAALNVGGNAERFAEKHEVASARSVIEFLALDPDNATSIYAGIDNAREGARATRGTITSEMWENINDTWLEMRTLTWEKMELRGLSRFFDWVKERSHVFRGVADGTMLRDDSYLFLRLGTFLERADNTARMIDVKYHLLLPEGEQVGGAVDYYQWGALLRSLSSFRAYKRLFHDTIIPIRVGELLILRPESPRSLDSCYREIDGVFKELREIYRRDFECFRHAGEIYSRLRYSRIEDIFKAGLHEFLDDFVARNDFLGQQISADFMLRV